MLPRDGGSRYRLLVQGNGGEMWGVVSKALPCTVASGASAALSVAGLTAPSPILSWPFKYLSTLAHSHFSRRLECPSEQVHLRVLPGDRCLDGLCTLACFPCVPHHYPLFSAPSQQNTFYPTRFSRSSRARGSSNLPSTAHRLPRGRYSRIAIHVLPSQISGRRLHHSFPRPRGVFRAAELVRRKYGIALLIAAGLFLWLGR